MNLKSTHVGALARKSVASSRKMFGPPETLMPLNWCSYRILIGSPKERQPTDGATGTAQLLRSEYDEQYASGNLHSCTLELDSINPQTCAASARPNTSSGNDHIVTNRNAFGLSLGANRQNPAEVTVSEKQYFKKYIL